MPEAWVYLLRCRDESLYTGWTVDLERALARHRDGTASRYTASRVPLELELAMPMPDRSGARREEARLKRLPRATKRALLPWSFADKREYPFAVAGDERRADAVDRRKLGQRPRRSAAIDSSVLLRHDIAAAIGRRGVA